MPRENLLEAARKKLARGKTKALALRSTRKWRIASRRCRKALRREMPRRRALRNHQRSWSASIDESLCAWNSMRSSSWAQTDATQNLIRNFFLAEKYRKGNFENAPGKNRARGGDWRRRHGLGHCAMAQLARRLGYFARRRCRGDRSRPGQHRQNLRRCGEARTDERGESEGRPRAHCGFDATRRNARRADRDRSRLGKTRDQKENLSAISRRRRRQRHSGDEYFGAADRRTGRRRPDRPSA